MQLVSGNGYRLPTEVEWEIACRAGTSTEYSFGSNEAWLKDYGWFGENAGEQVQPVGAKRPNRWGLHDLHGNLWEWCQEPYEEDSDRVHRGGSWNDPAWLCRSAYRLRRSPVLRASFLGFRVARSPFGE